MLRAGIERIDLDVDADHPVLLLEQLRVLAPQDARRRHQDAEREGLPIAVPDPVAVVIAPAACVQDARRLGGVVRELADFRIPDPQQRGHRARGHLSDVTERALD